MSMNEIGGRNTGKTYRVALEAALLASRGARVIVISGNDAEHCEIRGKISAAVSHHATQTTRNKWDFAEGGGYVRLCYASEDLHGHRYDVAFKDELRGLSDKQVYDIECRVRSTMPFEKTQ